MLCMDALHASLLASLSSKERESFNLHTWPIHVGPIIPEDKHNAFYEAYTKTIQAGIVPPLTETEVWLGPLWLT